MQLHLNKVIPTYFEAEKVKESGIWLKDLAIRKGEFVKVVAPSGSGKTSLMHFLYGMRGDYNGSIAWGTLQYPVSPEQLAKLRSDTISIVLQDLRLFPEQTVFQNIDIKRKLNPYHQPGRIKEMAEKLGIGTKLQSLCKTCSYGEQQRVAIIRALMQPFDFLLMDEPFSHLDNSNSEIAMQLILEEAKAREAAIVFADLERIEFFPYETLYHL
ncbi:MAG: ATP-binding cassette domain-containing protein [Chitinophagaceae bacterium]|nr:ATP-binding cassette domain-containing protein [Chitinophagaceae bacterium]